MEKKDLKILGTFDGECADSNITNLNGLDITREVWENVFNSDEYKQAIENGWYIGYLGHPEDPGCQEFEKACIVMTEGHIDDNGKIYGTFNLIDTPVGRIVKSFQDAGVTFGISVRGAGDIVSNSVDPETFVFRGFDLVAFPAYPESVPEFIAASSDVEKQKKYKAVCATINANIDSLDNVETINILQSHLAKQSDEYIKLENKKKEIEECDDVEECDDLDYEQIRGMYNLYMEEKNKNGVLSNEIKSLKKQIRYIKSDNARRLKSVERIMTSQINDMNRQYISAQNKIKYNQKITASTENNFRKIESKYDKLKMKYEKLESKYKNCQSDLDDINDINNGLEDKIESLEKEVKDCKNSNLIYKEEIDSANKISVEKDDIITSLNAKLDETVEKLNEYKEITSNRDEKLESLKSELNATIDLVQEYQESYANLYANALGVYLPKVNISASSSVKDIQEIILGNSDINRQNRRVLPTDLSAESFDSFENDGLVTI